MLPVCTPGASPNPAAKGTGRLTGGPLLVRGLLISLLALLGGCGGQPEKPQTLGDIDLLPSAKEKSVTAGSRTPSTQSQAQTTPGPALNSPPRYDRSRTKQAYYDYVQSASKDDAHRALA